MVTTADGRLAVFKIAASGRLEYRVQTRSMNTANTYLLVGWFQAQRIESGPQLAGSPSAVLNADGTVEVVARGADGVMYRLRQSTADPNLPISSFGGWQPLPALADGVSFAGSPLISEINGDTRREVVALGSDGNFWVTAQGTTAAAGYTAWTMRYGAGQGLRGAPSAVADANGRWHLWFSAQDGSLRSTVYDRNLPVGQHWSGSFVTHGTGWPNPVAAYLSANGRLTVAGVNASQQLVVQPFAPAGTATVVSPSLHGTPSAATSGSSTYLAVIRADGRVQLAPVNNDGAPSGDWYVIDQPDAPTLVSPANDSQVYSPGPVTLVAGDVADASEYRFEVWEVGSDGSLTPVFTETAAEPTVLVPGGTMTAGRTYRWTVRAWSTLTQLLSHFRLYDMVASETTAGPAPLRPTGGAVVDPYGTIKLTARAVQGATSYRFRVQPEGSTTVTWSTTIAVSTAPGEEISAVVPANRLTVGTRYQWRVTSISPTGVDGDTSNPTSILATTGAAGSSMMARTTTGNGYWLIDYAGNIAGFGDAEVEPGARVPLPAGWRTVGVVAQPRSARGFWVLADSGAIYTFGGAPYLDGADGQMPAGAKAVAMATTPTGNGYWILADFGGIYTFGDAQFYDGVRYPAGERATSMAPRPDGRGYWILSNRGGVTTRGTSFYGSAISSIPAVDQPAFSIQTNPTGTGYWIASAAGGVYTFGTGVDFHGGANTPGELNGNRAAGFAVTPRGNGYWFMQDWPLNANAGAVFTFGNGAGYYGGGNVTARPAQPSAPVEGDRFFPRNPNSVPTLTVSGGSGANGRQYRFFLATDPTATSEIIESSSWQTATSWTPPPSLLRDGTTYYWRVHSRDTGIVNPPTLYSRVASFKVERRFGSGTPSPYETAGPMSVNLASGNLTTSWASPEINGASLGLTFNSLAVSHPAEPGLPRGWSTSWGGDTAPQSLDRAGGTITIRMADGSSENFTLGRGVTTGNSWRPDDDSDSTLTETPASTWVYTVADGTVYEFDQFGKLTATHHPVDQRRSSALRYTWSDTPVGRRMTTAQDPISGRVMTLHFRNDGRGGCATSTPAGVVAAPPGYLCRVQLMDNRTYDIWYTPTGVNDLQIARITGSDTTTTAFEWEVANVASLGGQHARIIRRLDPLAADVIAAGLRADDQSTRTEVRYAADGRVDRLTRPAPSAGAARQSISISYTATGATVNRDGDVRPNGYSRQVEFDTLGRQTLERDQGGRTSTTAWRGTVAGDDVRGDFVAYATSPSGLRSGTVYDDQMKPIQQWGPAPTAWFGAAAAGNEWGARPTSTHQPNTPRTVTNYDEGLQGLALSFFDSTELTGGVKRRTTQSGASFNIGTAGFEGLDADGFSVRAEALLRPTVTGTYRLLTNSDGGSRVYINDTKVADSWDQPDGTLRLTQPQRVQPINLTANKRVKLRVEYKDTTGNARFDIRWQPPGQAEALIPVSRLQPNYALVTSTVDPDGRIARTGYADPSNGLATSSTQVVGGGQADLVSTVTYEPDSATTGWRRPISRTLPAGPNSAITYDYYPDAGDPVPNSCGVTAGTNQAGRPKSTTAADPDGTGPERAIKRWYVYDTAGRTRGLLITTADITESALAAQPWQCTSFDDRGRDTTSTFPAFGGTPSRTVTYNHSNPLQTLVTDPVGSVTTTVDLLGQNVHYRDVFGYTTTRSYDVAGRPTTSTLSGPGLTPQTTASTYQADGLLDTVAVNGRTVADMTYLPDGRPTRVDYPTGTSALGNNTYGEFGYDTLQRPSSVTWRRVAAPGTLTTTGSLIASEHVTRLLSGKLRNRSYDEPVASGTAADFSYDGAGRLTRAVVQGIVHSYDFADSNPCPGGAAGAGRNSNRTAKTVGGTATTYCYDAADRLISTTEPTVGTIEYDTRGNTTRIFGETHAYDIADRHLSTTKDSTTVSYVRDATDRIVERRLNGTAVARYVASGGGDTPSATVDMASGDVDLVWSLPGGALFNYQPTNESASTWTYPSIQGSALAIATQSGGKQGVTRIWDPDGNNLNGGIPDNMPGSFDYGWLGLHQRPLEHQSGISPAIQMGERKYSPVLGRFLEVDPLEGGTSNDYAYVDDPINHTDLDGRCSFCKRVWNKAKRVVSSPFKAIARGFFGMATSTGPRTSSKSSNPMNHSRRGEKTSQDKKSQTTQRQKDAAVRMYIQSSNRPSSRNSQGEAAHGGYVYIPRELWQKLPAEVQDEIVNGPPEPFCPRDHIAIGSGPVAAAAVRPSYVPWWGDALQPSIDYSEIYYRC